MVHPDARVVGHERDLVGLARRRPRGSRPTTGCRSPASPSRDSTSAWCPCRCIGCVSPLSLSIVEHHDVALVDHEHRDVGEQVAVDRPPEPGPAVEEAGPPPDPVVERAGRGARGRSPSVAGRRRRSAGRRTPRRARVVAAGGSSAEHRAWSAAEVDPRAPPPGTTNPRSTRPPAGTRTASPSTASGPLTSCPSTASTRYGAPVTQSAGQRRCRCSRPAPAPAARAARRPWSRPPRPLSVAPPSYRCSDRERSTTSGRRAPRGRPRAPRAGRGAPARGRSGASGTSTSRPGRRRTGRRDCSPGSTASWVTPATPSSAFGTSIAVPVQRDAVGDVLVDQGHLDQVTLGRPDRRARGRAVDGVAVARPVATGQVVSDVGAAGAGPRPGPRPACPCAVVVVAGPRPAAVVGVPHRRHVVGFGQPAGPPHPGRSARQQPRSASDRDERRARPERGTNLTSDGHALGDADPWPPDRPGRPGRRPSRPRRTTAAR